MFGIFIKSFIIGLTGAMMPGPMLAVTIEHSHKKGLMAGPLIVLGHSILELLLLILLVFGLGSIINSNTSIIIISLIGAIVLFWMGWDMIKNASKIKFASVDEKDDKEKKSAVSINSPVFAGILTSLSNPYWTLWWATIGLNLILDSMRNIRLGIVYFYFGHIMSDLVWFSIVSISIVMSKKIISDKHFQIIITICGVILIGFGLIFGYNGVSKI